MTDTINVVAFCQHNAERYERIARDAKHDPKTADGWYAKAAGMHAILRELARLQRIEELARAVDQVFDDRSDVIRLRVRVDDGTVDHRERFLKLRAALLVNVPVVEKAKAKGELA